MISISSNLNIMIKAVEKASKSIIRDFGEVEKLDINTCLTWLAFTKEKNDLEKQQIKNARQK